METAHCKLPCFACWRKTPPNKWRAAKPYKMVMNWAKEREKQAKINPSLRKWNQFISIFMPVLLRFNNYFVFVFFFSGKSSYKSFVLCKTVSKHSVIYAMTERGLPVNGSSQMLDSTGTSLSGKMNRCSSRPCSHQTWGFSKARCSLFLAREI